MMHHLTPDNIIEYGKKKLYEIEVVELQGVSRVQAYGHRSGWSQVPGDDPEVQHV
ncbi:hypothetical protein F2Q70_00015540 [Brassica cretica]|uniref:Uncharacterized protein n=1 Tax=Brassica cretica TaxID=69181 RepID=A0A3N6RNS7_BRACR|nr:hypothetical protein F2Q70_00015540 [Brassica cretica]